MLKAERKKGAQAPYNITTFHQLKGRKEPAMKKNSNKTEQETREQKNTSIATSDLKTIIAAAEEYIENGYSYPLFTPGCGCD